MKQSDKSTRGAESPAAGVRLDVWLWAARLRKTRSLAKTTIEAGRVRIGGQVVNKPARLVRVGDLLSVPVGDSRVEVRVLGLSDRRGPAPVARQLYAETEASQAARAAAAETRRLGSGYLPPDGRPDKQARRQLLAFLDEMADGDGSEDEV
jgi:ribosome-associated heat shock protein Hsp15